MSLYIFLILAPTEPRKFKAIGKSQYINLQWKIPDPTNGIITGYHICYKILLSDGEPVPGVDNCSAAAASASTHNLTHLGTIYFIICVVP